MALGHGCPAFRASLGSSPAHVPSARAHAKGGTCAVHRSKAASLQVSGVAASSYQPCTCGSRNGNYGILGPGSLRLEAGKLDHLCRLLGLVCDELSEIRGGATKHHSAQIGEPRLHLGVDESRIKLLVQLVDDIGGR